MTEADQRFFEVVISAGAIVAGFCSSFLVFRIQRESNYYRQPALSFEHKEARDVYIGLTHFTSSLLLLILAAFCSLVFGFVIPLLALSGVNVWFAKPGYVASGLVASVILLFGYFVDEMVHYGILSRKLENDA